MQMQIESTTYRTIKLELKKDWYINYLKFVFATEEDPIKINRTEPLGKMLFSMVRTSNLPMHFCNEKPFVKLVMPSHGHDTGKYKFMYYTAEDVERISDYIEAMAYIDHRTMIVTGRNDLGMDKKTVVSIFSTMIYGEDCYEALTKDEYRKRKKYALWLQKSAKEFGYR
jgi:hypothetical protein